MTEEPKPYELTFIVSGNLAETEQPAVLTKIKTLLESEGALLARQEDLGRRKLAYPIKHLKHGFYYSWCFNLVPQKLVSLSKELSMDTQLLRFLIINKHQKSAAEIAVMEKIKARRVKEKIKEKIVEETKAKEVATEKSKKPKFSLEDLDKKLDELLGEKIL